MRVDYKSIVVSAVIALFPLLAVYKSVVPGVDLATFIVLILVIYALFNEPKVFLKRQPVGYLFGYLLIISPIVFFIFFRVQNGNYPAANTVFLRWAKMLVVMLAVFFSPIKRYFVEKYFVFCIRWVVYLSALFVCVQRCAYAIGIIVNNPFLQFATYEGYSLENYSMITGELFRPSAFFLEPSHLSQYCIVYICWLLFSGNQNKSWFGVTISACAIMCTGSGMGLALVGLVLLFYVLNRGKKNIFIGVFCLGVFALLWRLIYSIPYIKTVIGRVFSDGSEYGGNVIEERIGEGYKIFGELPLFNKMFGTGYGNVPVDEYLNGVTYIINSLGIIGVIFLLIVIAKYWKKNLLYKKVVLLLFGVMLFFAQLFNPAYLVFIFMFCDNDGNKFLGKSFKKVNCRE